MVVVAEGERSLGVSAAADLDDPAGQVVMPRGGRAERVLDVGASDAIPLGVEPLNNALLALGGQATHGRDGCLSQLPGPYAIGAGSLVPGTHVCVLTNDAHVSELVVVENEAELRFQFTTWDLPDS